MQSLMERHTKKTIATAKICYCLLILTVISTKETSGQVLLDMFGNRIQYQNFDREKPTLTDSDTTYVLTDTLPIPAEFQPGPGQLSKDGLEYYLTLFRYGGVDSLFVLKRSRIGEQFGPPLLLGGVVNQTTLHNCEPSITADKRTLLFVRSLDGTWDGNDLYLATRPDTSLPFDSVRALTEINQLNLADAYPWISPDGLHLYYSRGNPSTLATLFVTTRDSLDDLFGAPQPIGLNFPDENFAGWLSDDELELYFTERIQDAGISYACRPTPDDSFSTPVHHPEFSGLGFVSGPSKIENEFYIFNSPPNYSNQILKFTPMQAVVKFTSLSFTIANNIEIYPNPAKSVIRVRGPFPEKTIKIFDITGKIIKEIEILHFVQNDRTGDTKISLKGISPGIYFLKLGEETKKFLVVK